MDLSPREKDNLLLFTAALLAERRKDRGLKLNHPEAVAFISAALLEGAREGREVGDLGEVIRARKVFGKVLSWVPFIAKAYALPTPDNLLAVAKKVGGDSTTLLDAVDEVSYTRSQGLCFLLKAEEILARRD